MKKTITLLAALLLTLLSGNVYAQKKADNDYNLKKAYEVLNEEKDEEDWGSVFSGNCFIHDSPASHRIQS